MCVILGEDFIKEDSLVKKQSALGPLFLVGAALIWGLAFVFQRSSMEHIGPFTFGALRYALSALCLFPIAYSKRNREIPIAKDPTIRWGVVCGLLLFAGTNLQQLGLVYTTAGKAGFITALYIVVVPLLSGFFLKRHVSMQSWLCVGVATLGFYLLSIHGGFHIELGDFIIFIGVFFWAGHIFVIDKGVGSMEPLLLSLVQMVVASVLSFVLALTFESISISGIKGALGAILYTGILSGSIAYTLQMYGQRHTEPTLASLIMSLESVFAVAAGYLFLNEVLSFQESLGALIIFVAVILAQVPLGRRKETL